MQLARDLEDVSILDSADEYCNRTLVHVVPVVHCGILGVEFLQRAFNVQALSNRALQVHCQMPNTTRPGAYRRLGLGHGLG